MRVVSFDVFDTLLVRVQARPRDVFFQLGTELAAHQLSSVTPEVFARRREEAELAARQLIPGGEVTLAEIYAALAPALGWDDATRTEASQRELALESRSLKAVPAMGARVTAARTEADAIWFLSDMYLPGAFIEEVLRREGCFHDGDRIFVSGECRASKHRGDLFTHARAQAAHPITSWLHIGDHEHADERMPRTHGIRTERFRDATLNRYERLASGPPAAENWRSLLAGAMRRARLANPNSDPAQRMIWDTGCDIVGPLVLGFVHWCLTEAQARGLRRLYFVARDGQLPLRVVERLASTWGFSIDCRYLYGSRQAWHPAAADAGAVRDRAIAYLRQQGLFDGIPWAMVDIGWHGNLQRSLARVLAAGGHHAPLQGFYFGLVPDVPDSDGSMLGYWNQRPGQGHGVRQLNHALWEIFLSADHGSVMGYREESGRWVPELREARNERALTWGVATLQAAVLKFAECCLEVMPRPPGAPGEWLAVVRTVYLEFYRHPTRSEAVTWGGIPFSDGQVEKDFHCLTPRIAGPLWRAIRPARRPLYWWPEGALAQQACWPLRVFLALRDLKRGISG
jgi:FMN phosphatase YigB (HAD superfamily)